MRINTNLTQEQMIKEVNDYLMQIGLDETILGLKTNQDKVLYYHNYLNSSNTYGGVLEFSNLYYIKLANLLCNTTERIKLFQEKFYDADGNVAQQFRQFRRYLLDSRTNTEEYLNVIDKMIKGQCFEQLHMTLEELFLEPIPQNIFDRIIEMIHSGLCADDIYFFYTTKRNVKSLVTYDISYIKSLQK
jgi:hypothetical protein